MIWSSFFIVVGILSTSFIVLFILRVVYETFIYSADIRKYQAGAGEDGAYALITGSTSGIGEGFAYECARLGFNLILVGRNDTKLRHLITLITAQYPAIRAEYVVSDASAGGRVEVDRVIAAASKLPIRLLINNVGIATQYATMLNLTPIADTEGMIEVNVRYSTLITAGILPMLIAHKANRCGIINVSSASSRLHVAMLAVYSGTKAYNLAFSNALNAELSSNSSIDVLCVTPGYVQSSMTRVSRTSISICSSRQCARDSMSKLGLREHSGYAFHHISLKLSSLIPADMRSRWFLKGMLIARAKRENKKAMKRAQQEKDQ